MAYIPSYTEQRLDKTREKLHNFGENKISKESLKKNFHNLVDGTIITLSSIYKLWSKTKEYIKEYPKRSLIALLLITMDGQEPKTIIDDNIKTKDEISISSTIHTKQESKIEYTIKSLEQSKKEFGDFVALHKDLHQYDKSSTFWRWIRIARYDKNIRKALEHAPHITFESFQGLYMVEWEGNTASINSRDGWAGLLHIQPDVAKELNMKIFTDAPEFSQYDFDHLKSKGMSMGEIYALHGKLLQQIVEENDGQSRLASLDDRFDPQTCLIKVATKLEKTYNKATILLNDNNTWPKETTFKDYVKNTIHGDIYQYAAINGYNKWWGSFYVISTEKSGNHMMNVKKNADDAKKYNKVLEQGILQWLEGEKLRDYIIQHINP